MAEPAPPIIEVTVAAPIDVVWRALREPEQLRRWHGWDYVLPDGTDALAAEIQVIYFNDAVTEDPPHRLSIGTDVFDLTETAGGVRVRITRAPRGANPDWDAYYDDVTEGWTTFLQQLKWALERHPGQDRVTHFLSGVPHVPGPIVPRLGIADLVGVDPGTSYTATLPSGAVTGRVAFTAQRQLGLTVDQWGDGLLVIGESAPAPHRPEAASMIVATTYDLPAEGLAALRSAWDRWWDSEFRREDPLPTAP